MWQDDLVVVCIGFHVLGRVSALLHDEFLYACYVLSREWDCIPRTAVQQRLTGCRLGVDMWEGFLHHTHAHWVLPECERHHMAPRALT